MNSVLSAPSQSNCICPPEQKDKAEPFDVAEVMQEMSRGQVQTLWGKLAALLEDILQELPPEHWEDGGEEGMDVKTAADPVSLEWMHFGGGVCLRFCHIALFVVSLFSFRNMSWLLCMAWRSSLRPPSRPCKTVTPTALFCRLLTCCMVSGPSMDTSLSRWKTCHNNAVRLRRYLVNV